MECAIMSTFGSLVALITSNIIAIVVAVSVYIVVIALVIVAEKYLMVVMVVLVGI